MKWLLRINWLGIDVALGAGALSFALSYTWDRILPWNAYVLLILVVWQIYAVDHLRDVYDRIEQISTPRRHFHSRNHGTMLALMAIALVISIALLYRQSLSLIIPGLLLAVFVAMYFVLLQYFSSIMASGKELVAALFYALGIFLIPYAAGPVPQYLAVHVLQVYFLALSNLLLFSWFDFEQDREEGFNGVVSLLGLKKTKRLLRILIPVHILICATLIIAGFQPAMELCFLTMNLILLLPLRRPAYWAHDHRFRIIGDAIFFLPRLTILDGRF